MEEKNKLLQNIFLEEGEEETRKEREKERPNERQKEPGGKIVTDSLDIMLIIRFHYDTREHPNRLF